MRIALLLLLIIAGGMAYIRLAPSDPARWNRALPDELDLLERPANAVFDAAGGAAARLSLEGSTLDDIMSRLDEIALATPRTYRLARASNGRRITWVTRSLIFGFPDYTTAEIISDGHIAIVGVYARERFGRYDFGVNATRLRDWTARLSP